MAVRVMTSRYRPTPDVPTAMRSTWTPTEKQFQALVTELAGQYGFAVYHPFDSRRSTAGYPDLTLVKPPRLIFVELKVGKYQITDQQREWLEMLGECGVEAYVLRSTGDRVQDTAGIVGLLREKPKRVAA